MEHKISLLKQLLLYIRPRIIFKSADRHIVIKDTIENRRAVRLLLYDGIRESGMYLDAYGDRDPLFKYMQTLKIVLDHHKHLDNLLLIGGGGFVFPRIYLNDHPERKVTVVELDPGYVELAKRFFFLDLTDSRIKVVIDDGQRYINEKAHENTTQAYPPQKKYDLIVYDAYIGDNPALGILSESCMRNVRKLLSPNGIYALNMINDHIDVISMQTRLAESTLKLIFAHTRITMCPGGGNCILMASDRKL